MILAFETILIKNNILQNLRYHENRMNNTRREVFGANIDIKIKLDNNLVDGRCKLIYNQEIQSVEFAPYYKQKIKKLKFVNANINYNIKWLDRKELDTVEDSAIIVKNGLITDTKIANVAFFDGTNWLTPASPILAGTTRSRLLDNGVLKLADLTPADIMPHYKIAIMNALRGFEDLGTIRDVLI